jgi:hypothetical protein
LFLHLTNCGQGNELTDVKSTGFQYHFTRSTSKPCIGFLWFAGEVHSLPAQKAKHSLHYLLVCWLDKCGWWSLSNLSVLVLSSNKMTELTVEQKQMVLRARELGIPQILIESAILDGCLGISDFRCRGASRCRKFKAITST